MYIKEDELNTRFIQIIIVLFINTMYSLNNIFKLKYFNKICRTLKISEYVYEYIHLPQISSKHNLKNIYTYIYILTPYLHIKENKFSHNISQNFD